MTRIPQLSREDMSEDQRRIHDRILEKNGRVGFGPAIGYAYSAELWRLHNESSAHLLNCSLTPQQVRIVALMTVRHWNAPYPWAAQAKVALKAGLEPDVIEAINAGREPEFTSADDAQVHALTCDILATGTVFDETFAQAAETLGHHRMVEVIGAIGHFCTTALMSNLVGVQAPDDAPSTLLKT